MTPTRLRSSSCQQQRRPAGGELKSESQIRQQPAGSPGPANQMQIRPPHAGRAESGSGGDPAALHARSAGGVSNQASDRAHAHARAPVKKSRSARGLGRWEWEGCMDWTRSKSNRRHPACLSTLSCPVVGAQAPSEKQKKYRKKLPRAPSPRSLSLSLPVEGRRVVQSASSRLQISSSRGPALSSLLSSPSPPRPVVNRRLLWRELVDFFFGFFWSFRSPTFSWFGFLCTGIFGWLVIFPQLLFGFCARAPSCFLLLRPVDSGGHSVEHLPCGGGGWRFLVSGERSS